MLVTASTVLDTPANVRRFVDHNLAMAVDHMFVFCDAPGAPGQREVVEELSRHDLVTCVPTDRDWWHGDRPSRLNVRQRINANLVVRMLEGLDEVAWVCHVDGDEVVAADRDVLDSVPEDVPAVWLTPLEAVSTTHAADHPTSFKSLLEKPELHLLATLGVIEAPTNRALFHGHVLGKSGVRPGAGLGLSLHDAIEPPGRRLARGERFEHPSLRVLHYDAISAQEFVRKWRDMVAAGPVSLRPDRAPLVQALRGLVHREAHGLITPEVAERYLHRLYELTTLDDVDTLSELGLLQEVDPAAGTHRPADFSPTSDVAGRLDRMRELPKRAFHVNHGADDEADGDPGPWRRLRQRVVRR